MDEETPTTWAFWRVTFDFGTQLPDDPPKDPAEFLAWLNREPNKILAGLKLKPAVLRTAPF